MAKQTLLEMVQDILSDADGDEVNSITDTIESEQCSRVIRDAFYHVTDVNDFEQTKTLVELDATSATTPNVMTRPTGLYNIEFVKYNTKDTAGGNSEYTLMKYLEPYDFLDRQHGFDTDNSNVTEVTLSTGHPIPVLNDRAPSYYTIMDEGSDELVFDAYDSDIETNLQQSKSLAYGMQKPSFTLSDSFQMSLPQHLETLVKNTAKAMYFDLYKDGITPEIDRRRRQAEVRAMRLRHTVVNSDNNRSPDYGRNPRK